VRYDPLFDKLTQRKWRKKLEHFKWRTGQDSVFVGRFESTRHDSIRGFGHMDMYRSQLVVMSAEQVQSLGKFSAFPGAFPESESTHANRPRQLTLCETLKLDPDDAEIRVTATLKVLKEASFFKIATAPIRTLSRSFPAIGALQLVLMMQRPSIESGRNPARSGLNAESACLNSDLKTWMLFSKASLCRTRSKMTPASWASVVRHGPHGFVWARKSSFSSSA
jgi:hypothetical protein